VNFKQSDPQLSFHIQENYQQSYPIQEQIDLRQLSYPIQETFQQSDLIQLSYPIQSL